MGQGSGQMRELLAHRPWRRKQYEQTGADLRNGLGLGLGYMRYRFGIGPYHRLIWDIGLEFDFTGYRFGTWFYGMYVGDFVLRDTVWDWVSGIELWDWVGEIDLELDFWDIGLGLGFGI